MVNPRVSHPPVITIDVGGFSRPSHGSKWSLSYWLAHMFWQGLPAMICHATGFSLASRTCRSTWSLSPWRFFLCSLFFWGFHGVPKLAGCLSSWENPHWNGWWLGVPIKKSRVNLMKLDETQDIGNRNRGSSSWWGRTSLCFVFI